MSKEAECDFEKQERISEDFWDDERWKKVNKLREQGNKSEANSLVMEIRSSWGV